MMIESEPDLNARVELGPRPDIHQQSAFLVAVKLLQ